MQAQIGDHILVHGRQVGAATRSGTIVGVRGSDGTPPYSVRWDDSAAQSLVYPGPDAEIGPDQPGLHPTS